MQIHVEQILLSFNEHCVACLCVQPIQLSAEYAMCQKGDPQLPVQSLIAERS